MPVLTRQQSRQQEAAAGPSFEDMVAQLEEVKMSQREVKEMAQDISGSLDEAMEELMEENKKLKEENNRLKLEDDTLEDTLASLNFYKEANEELKEQNKKWTGMWGDEDLETQARRWQMVAIGADEHVEKLKKENEEWRERFSCYEGTEEDATPDVMWSYLESKTDEIYELHDEMEEKDDEIKKLKEKLTNIQESCVGDGLEYLVEDK